MHCSNFLPSVHFSHIPRHSQHPESFPSTLSVLSSPYALLELSAFFTLLTHSIPKNLNSPCQPMLCLSIYTPCQQQIFQHLADLLKGAAVIGLSSQRCSVPLASSRLAGWTCDAGTWGCTEAGRRQGWWRGLSRRNPWIWWSPSLVVEEEGAGRDVSMAKKY